MIISLIVAMSENRVIGIDNSLPWHLPGDLKWFKRNTVGKTVIMGRKTYESIGRPLPERRNVVISRNPDYQAPGCDVVPGLEQALALVEPDGEAMIMGGASLYEQTLPRADRLYLTLVHAQVDGDAWFPEVHFDQWHELERIDHEGGETHPYSFLVWERI